MSKRRVTDDYLEGLIENADAMNRDIPERKHEVANDLANMARDLLDAYAILSGLALLCDAEGDGASPEIITGIALALAHRANTFLGERGEDGA